KHRLEDHLYVFRRVHVAAGHRKVPVDPDPVHVMETQDLVFADDRHIVFRVTGYNAGGTADTGVEIDGHAPMNAGLVVYIIKCALLFEMLDTAEGFKILFTLID